MHRYKFITSEHSRSINDVDNKGDYNDKFIGDFEWFFTKY